MELKISAQARGTRILALEKSTKYRSVCDALVRISQATGAEELVLPFVEPVSLYPQITRQLCTFPDPTEQGRVLCLRPDGTATCSHIAETVWKVRHDVKVFYVTKCWRYQRRQFGHHREFTQFGFHILNPRSDYTEWVFDLAKKMVTNFTNQVTVNRTHGEYPFDQDGFDIGCEYLGSEKQGLRGRICLGGRYKNGYGVVLEVERMMLL